MTKGTRVSTSYFTPARPKVYVRNHSQDLQPSPRRTELSIRDSMPLNELHFITGNKNKLAEAQAILGDVIPLRSHSLDLTEIQGTIEEVSKDKCWRAAEAVCQSCDGPFLQGTDQLHCRLVDQS